MITDILLTIIYAVYILLWFIGCCFATFSIMEKLAYKKDVKNDSTTQLLDALLFLSVATLCFSGLGKYLTVFDAIDKIKDLW